MEEYRMSNVKKKKWPWVLIDIAVIMLVIVLLIYNQMNERKITISENMSSSELKLSSLEDSISASGTIASENSVNITSNLSYTIKQVNVKVGDLVKKGDILAEFDTTELNKAYKDAKESYDSAKEQYNLKVSQAEEALNTAKKNVTESKSNLQDAKKTYASLMGDASDSKAYKERYEEAEDKDQATISAKQTLTNAESNLTQAQNNYDNAVINDTTVNAKTQLDTAKDNLKDANIIAPMDGVVAAINVSVDNAPTGGTVGATGGALFTIQDENDFLVKASVADYDIIKMNVGNVAQITVDSTDDKYEGKIETISPIANSAGNYDFEVSIGDNTLSNLRVGMNVTVKIVLQEKKDIFVVSVDSIVEKSGKKYVIAIDTTNPKEIKKTEIEVTTGMETDYYVEITGTGLSEGLNIMNDPLNQLKVDQSATMPGGFSGGRMLGGQ